MSASKKGSLAQAYSEASKRKSDEAQKDTTTYRPCTEFAAPVPGMVGLGVDIVEIERMKRILMRSPCFKQRVFSEQERAYCDSSALPEVHYATRFAAKEAVLKALGTGFSEGIGVRDVEVRRNAAGRPLVFLSGRAKQVAKKREIKEIPLSLSYTHTEAVGCALAITEDSTRVQQQRVNPLEELTQQFKQARSLLDDLTPSQSTADAEAS